MDAVPNGIACLIPVHFLHEDRNGSFYEPSTEALNKLDKVIESFGGSIKVLRTVYLIQWGPQHKFTGSFYHPFFKKYGI